MMAVVLLSVMGVLVLLLACIPVVLHRLLKRGDGDLALMRCKLRAGYFNGKVAWVTGASSGIGEALARELVGLGARVILSSRSVEELNRVQMSICSPENTRVLPLDLAKPEELVQATRTAMSFFGHIDLLFNNAGVANRGLHSDFCETTERTIMDVNFFGHIMITKAALASMTKTGRGHIVNTLSIVVRIPRPGRVIYCASKMALLGYMECLRQELFGLGFDIPVTNICPAPVATKTDVNALLGDGTAFGQRDAITLRGMKPHRCAQLILIATSNRLDEAWIGSEQFLSVAYVNYYLPILGAWICRRQAKKIIAHVQNICRKKS